MSAKPWRVDDDGMIVTENGPHNPAHTPAKMMLCQQHNRDMAECCVPKLVSEHGLPPVPESETTIPYLIWTKGAQSVWNRSKSASCRDAWASIKIVAWQPIPPLPQPPDAFEAWYRTRCPNGTGSDKNLFREAWEAGKETK